MPTTQQRLKRFRTRSNGLHCHKSLLGGDTLRVSHVVQYRRTRAKVLCGQRLINLPGLLMPTRSSCPNFCHTRPVTINPPNASEVMATTATTQIGAYMLSEHIRSSKMRLRVVSARVLFQTIKNLAGAGNSLSGFSQLSTMPRCSSLDQWITIMSAISPTTSG